MLSLCVCTWSAYALEPWDSDWTPHTHGICKGQYAPLPYSATSSVNDPQSEPPLTIQSDQAQFVLEGRSEFKGNVELTYGGRYLASPGVYIDRDPHTQALRSLSAPSTVEARLPGIRIRGEDAFWSFEDKDLHLKNIQFRYYPRHLRGHAKQAEVNADQRLDLNEVAFTTCAPEQNTWALSAQSLRLDPKQARGQAKHIFLRAHGVPVAYFPYLDFPLNDARKTGFLYPDMGSTSQSGFELSIPFYWNIAPQYDVTFTPKFMSKRGIQFQNTFRYLHAHHWGDVQFNLIPHDSEYAHFKETTLSQPPVYLSAQDPRLTGINTSLTRWALSVHHSSQWTSQWSMGMQYDRVSDDNYFYDFGNDLKSASIYDLPQEIWVQYLGTHWEHHLRFHQYQTLHPLEGLLIDERYQRLPQWHIKGQLFEWGPLEGVISGQWTRFKHRGDVLTHEPVTQGHRVSVRPSIALYLLKPWGYFKPRLQWDFLWYDLDLGPKDQYQDRPRHIARSAPIWDLKTGLNFRRRIKRAPHLSQSLEPKLYYLKVPFRDQNMYPSFDSGLIQFSFSQMFRDNRFSGVDRLGDAHQLTLALSSRVVDERSGQERFRMSIGNIVYFKDRDVSLCDARFQRKSCQLLEDPKRNDHFSNIVAELYGQWDHFNTQLFVDWDPQRQHMSQSSLNFQYIREDYPTVNLGYYWLRNDPVQTDFNLGTTHHLQQTDISLIWPINPRWQMLGHWQYDFIENRSINLLGGLEYNGCCFAIQILGARYLKANEQGRLKQYANGLFLSVQLKGLSTIGFRDGENKLMRAIPGYRYLKDRTQF